MIKLLVIEDNDQLRNATVNLLCNNGYAAWGLSCSEDLAEFTSCLCIDIYILDLGLPGEDGLSVSRRIRSSHNKAGIIMMTARSSLNHRIEGYNCGADVFLPKPVNPDELLAVIQSLASRIMSKNEKECLLLLSSEMLLSGPNGQMSLTKRECLLLAGLARAPDSTLERWQIMEMLDPNLEHLNSDILEVCISQLRKKIRVCVSEDTKCFSSIKAIRGYGYRLLVDLRIN